MRPVRSLPKLGAHPELVTYQCDECRHVLTLPVENFGNVTTQPGVQ